MSSPGVSLLQLPNEKSISDTDDGVIVKLQILQIAVSQSNNWRHVDFSSYHLL